FAHNGAKHFWNQNRPVGLLVVLQDGQNGPTDGHGRAVERVDEARAFLPWNFVADIEPPRLIIRAIGGAGDLAVFAALASTRHPSFQIVLAISRPAQIARA